ncbi:hypothetical protein BDW72DRAFT_200835 [Aspergillus terricola var. indicus]
METEFYNSVNWAVTTDPTDALFPWDLGVDADMLPRSTQAEAVAGPGGGGWGELDQLLSASSYPVPEAQLQLREEDEYNSALPLFGGLLVDNDNQSSTDSGNQHTSADESTTATVPAPAPRPRPSKQRGSEPARKRGRPRKLIEDGGLNAEERRRTQVRMAQRAYRSRKEASVSSLKERIGQLEAAMKQISTAVISFGDDLVRSGALDTHPELLKPLGNTVQACLALPMIPHSESVADSRFNNAGHKRGMLLSSSSSSSDDTTGEATAMSIPEFIDRLHVTCSYQAYLVTANPSVPQRRIERPFRILLSLMPRAFVAEYFKDWLLARAGHKRMDQWDHIPFFRIGGAGTHYPVPNGNVHHPFPPPRSSATVQEDVSAFTADMGDEAEDIWFDLGDLQGYLTERRIVFLASSPGAGTVPLGLGLKEQAASDVARLMQSLVRSAICLGRSPGFRRRDVERVVDAFLASQTPQLV